MYKPILKFTNITIILINNNNNIPATNTILNKVCQENKNRAISEIAILIITIIIIIIERVITDLKKKEKRKKKGNIETPAGQPLTPRGFPRHVQSINRSHSHLFLHLLVIVSL